MQRDHFCSVVGLRKNGDRVVIATDITHRTAERIMSVMTSGSGFVEVFIEGTGDGETPIVASATCDEAVPAGVTESG